MSVSLIIQRRPGPRDRDRDQVFGIGIGTRYLGAGIRDRDAIFITAVTDYLEKYDAIKHIIFGIGIGYSGSGSGIRDRGFGISTIPNTRS